jgi:deoxyadenosine/deoxycytidine kinase
MGTVHRVIYLRTQPEVVYKRVKSHNRTGETGITLEYITDLHEAHNSWLKTTTDFRVTIIDGNFEPAIVLEKVKHELHDLHDKIQYCLPA